MQFPWLGPVSESIEWSGCFGLLLGPVSVGDLNYDLIAIDDSTATGRALLCNVLGDAVDCASPSRITRGLIGPVIRPGCTLTREISYC